MSKAEVKALYPKMVTPLGDGCFADIDPDYTGGKLDRVNLEWSGKDTNKQCGRVVTETLRTKYGEPEQVESNVATGDCGNSYAGGLLGALSNLCKASGGEDPTVERYALWVKDGIEITLKREAGSEATWYLVYRRAPQASKDAAKKL